MVTPVCCDYRVIDYPEVLFLETSNNIPSCAFINLDNNSHLRNALPSFLHEKMTSGLCRHNDASWASWLRQQRARSEICPKRTSERHWWCWAPWRRAKRPLLAPCGQPPTWLSWPWCHRRISGAAKCRETVPDFRWKEDFEHVLKEDFEHVSTKTSR